MPFEEWSPLLVGHVAGAVLALVLGAFQLRRRVRGDRFHKALGRTWAGLMYWVAGSSFFVREINNGRLSFIHILSAVTLVTLTLGIYFARKGNRRAHRGNMMGTYFGLVGAGIGAAVIPDRSLTRLATEETGAFVTALIGLVALGIGVIMGLRAWAKAGKASAPREAASSASAETDR